MSVFSFENLLWLFGTALLIPLIWVMQRRGQRKTFPYFFFYLLVVLVKSETLLLLKPFYLTAYFYAYWIAEAITILISFAVIYEIYAHVLTSGTLPVSKNTFFRIGVALLLLAALASMLTLQTSGYPAIIRIIFVLSSALRTVQVGLFVLLAFFSIFYGLYWTGQSFGIALGYAMFALAQLANTLVRASTGSVGHAIYVYVSMLAYQCAVLIWLGYAVKAREQAQLKKLPENDTAVWFGSLERLAR